jgi:hypothetical protein
MWLSFVINTPKTILKIQNSLQRHPFGGKIVWINNKANSTYFTPKIWNLGFQRIDACASTLWVGHQEPSGQHSFGSKMSVVVGDAHGLSVCAFPTYSLLPSTELNYQILISIDPPFDSVPLELLLLHPWVDHISWCEPKNKYPSIPIQKKTRAPHLETYAKLYSLCYWV